MRWIKIIGFLLLVLSINILTLKFVKNLPFFYMAAEALLVLVILAVKTKKPVGLRIFLVYAAIIVLILGLAEGFFGGLFYKFGITDGKHEFLKKEGSYYHGGYFRSDEIRGYAAQPNVKVRSKITIGNQLVHDVIYTTNQYGLRVAPHDLKPQGQVNGNFQNVVFFGCSCTVGEGVNDNETLPYLFEEKSKGKYHSYNFGFHGYGPHQMLRIIESGFLDKVITDKKPSIAVYHAITWHIDRSSGNYPYVLWGGNGPRYKLNSHGDVEYAGKFRNVFMAKVMNQLGKSSLFQSIFIPFLQWKRNRKDIELFIKIIKKSEQIFQEKYNGDFYVLLMTSREDKDYDDVLSELKRSQLKVITTEQIIRHYKEPGEEYLLRVDLHPSKLAYERYADYLLAYLEKNAVKN